jgi:hypothetical protein
VTVVDGDSCFSANPAGADKAYSTTTTTTTTTAAFGHYSPGIVAVADGGVAVSAGNSANPARIGTIGNYVRTDFGGAHLPCIVAVADDEVYECISANPAGTGATIMAFGRYSSCIVAVANFNVGGFSTNPARRAIAFDPFGRYSPCIVAVADDEVLGRTANPTSAVTIRGIRRYSPCIVAVADFNGVGKSANPASRPARRETRGRIDAGGVHLPGIVAVADGGIVSMAANPARRTIRRIYVSCIIAVSDDDGLGRSANPARRGRNTIAGIIFM